MEENSISLAEGAFRVLASGGIFLLLITLSYWQFRVWRTNQRAEAALKQLQSMIADYDSFMVAELEKKGVKYPEDFDEYMLRYSPHATGAKA